MADKHSYDTIIDNTASADITQKKISERFMSYRASSTVMYQKNHSLLEARLEIVHARISLSFHEQTGYKIADDEQFMHKFAFFLAKFMHKLYTLLGKFYTHGLFNLQMLQEFKIKLTGAPEGPISTAASNRSDVNDTKSKSTRSKDLTNSRKNDRVMRKYSSLAANI